MSSFRKGDRCVTYDATFVAGRIAEDAPVYQVRRETGAACAGSESPRVDSPSFGRALREEPEAIRPELADVRKTVGRSFAATPYHCARMAPYWSTDVVGIHRPSFEASSGPFSAKVGKVP